MASRPSRSGRPSAQNAASASVNASERRTRDWLSSRTRKPGSSPASNGCAREQPRAKAVDGRDPGPVDVAREVVAAELGETLADPGAQLAGRALRVRDHEHAVEREAAVADCAHEPLDEDGRLARARARRRRRRRPPPRSPRAARGWTVLTRHARRIRHIVQRSHHVGQVPPRGSWRTSPSRDAPDRVARPLDRRVDVRPRTRPRRGSPASSARAARRPRPSRAASPRASRGAGERAVEAAERLDPDEVAQREHVERDLELAVASRSPAPSARRSPDL